MEFLCTRNMGEKKFFDAWLNYVFDSNTYDVAYYDNYTTDIDIYHFDRSVSTASDLSKSTYHIKLIEAYPTLVGEISMIHTATEILKIPLTFTNLLTGGCSRHLLEYIIYILEEYGNIEKLIQ